MYTPKYPDVDLPLNKRQMTLLYTVGSYKYMTASLCAALHPDLVNEPPLAALNASRAKGRIHSPTIVTDGRRAMMKELTLLFNHGYVDRPPIQGLMRRPGGSHELIYGLMAKGRRVLESVHPGITKKLILHREKNQLRHLLHTLMTARFRVTITRAAARHTSFEISGWRSGNDVKAKVLVEGKQQALIPDGFFALRNGQAEEHFFLEADQDTMPVQRSLNSIGTAWNRKIAKYEAYYRSKVHEQRFNVKGFRVLTITPDRTRRDNIRKLASESPLRSAFYFADENDFDPQNSQSIFTPIWVTGRHEEPKGLL